MMQEIGLSLQNVIFKWAKNTVKLDTALSVTKSTLTYEKKTDKIYDVYENKWMRIRLQIRDNTSDSFVNAQNYGSQKILHAQWWHNYSQRVLLQASYTNSDMSVCNNKHNCAFHLCLLTLASVDTLQQYPIWILLFQKSSSLGHYSHSTVEYCISWATRASSLFSVTKSTSRLNFLRRASSCNFASLLTFFTSYQQTAMQHVNIISANQKAKAVLGAVSRHKVPTS